jgi:hypothetical protein
MRTTDRVFGWAMLNEWRQCHIMLASPTGRSLHSYVPDASELHILRVASRLGEAAKLMHGMPQTAVRCLRLGPSGTRSQTRRAVNPCREIALALSRIVAGADRDLARLTQRRRNAFASCRKIRRLLANARSPDQRRITESDSKFQSARDVRRRFDGETSWRLQTCCSKRGQCRQCTRCLRRTCRT